MPIIVEDGLSAIETLQKEGLFVISNKKATKQDIRPLKIVLVNLMPTKIDTEIQFIRLLSILPYRLN
jgi:homoserine O-succinyltransferase